MSDITFEVCADTGILLAKAEGSMKFKDIIDHYEILFQSPEFFVGIPAIYDFSKVTMIDGKMSNFQAIADRMSDSTFINKPSYIAIVINPEYHSLGDIFRAYAQMMDYTFMHVAVFNTNEDAEAWIGLNTHSVK